MGKLNFGDLIKSSNWGSIIDLATLLWEILSDGDFDYEDMDHVKELATDAINMTNWSDAVKNRRIVLAQLLIEEIFESFFKSHSGPVPIIQ